MPRTIAVPASAPTPDALLNAAAYYEALAVRVEHLANVDHAGSSAYHLTRRFDLLESAESWNDYAEGLMWYALGTEAFDIDPNAAEVDFDPEVDFAKANWIRGEVFADARQRNLLPV